MLRRAGYPACAGYDGNFEFKNPKRSKIIAFPAVSNYGAVSFAAADWVKNVETRLAAA
jgi:hypothetical protein